MAGTATGGGHDHDGGMALVGAPAGARCVETTVYGCSRWKRHSTQRASPSPCGPKPPTPTDRRLRVQRQLELESKREFDRQADDMRMALSLVVDSEWKQMVALDVEKSPDCKIIKFMCR